MQNIDITVHITFPNDNIRYKNDDIKCTYHLLDGSTLFVKKLCDIYASLEDDDLGFGNIIGCLLKYKAMRKKRNLMGSSVLKERAFKSKRKKSGVIGKTSTTA